MSKNFSYKFLIYFLLFLFVFLFYRPGFVSSSADNYNEHLYKGRFLFNQGKYTQAIAEYKKAQILKPASKESILNLALIHKNLRQYSKAIFYYKKLLKIKPDGIIYQNLGEVYYLNSMPEKAISVLNSALKMGQKVPLVYFWLGKSFQDKGDWDNAAWGFRQALALDEKFVLAHMSLGRFYMQKKMWASAQKEFERIRELDPSITEIYSLLAGVYFYQKRYAPALEMYRKVCVIDPDNIKAKESINKILALAGEDLEKKLSERKGRRLEQAIARKVKPKRVKQAPLVRVHIGDVKSLRFKCGVKFVIKNPDDEEVVFKGSKSKLYTILRNKNKISIFADKKKIKDFYQPIKIVHNVPSATTLIFDVESGQGRYWANKTDRIYRGQIDIGFAQKGYLRITNLLNMEEYLCGVLPSEMPGNWPAEALKAQAVAARSEAYNKLTRHKNEGYNFCSDVHCQAYNGAKVETKATNAAVDNTQGEVALYDRKPIDAVYSNSCGGHTQGNIFGDRIAIAYLKEKPDTIENFVFFFPLSALELEDWLWGADIPVFCNNENFSRRSNFRWMRIYSRQELEELINKKINIGRLISIDILERNISSHVHRIQIVGSRKKHIIEKELNIRQILDNLRSGMFNIDIKLGKKGLPVEFLFYGGGWGHGVGMCQVGAATMAQKGYTYEDILKFYYNDIQIKRMY